MKQSGFLLKQEKKNEDVSYKIQVITRQFMIDTLQMTLREELGWGYDRIMKVSLAWEAKRKEYTPAICPSHKMADVKQQHMQDVFREICAAKRLEPVTFKERYPYLKDIRYDRRYKD